MKNIFLVLILILAGCQQDTTDEALNDDYLTTVKIDFEINKTEEDYQEPYKYTKHLLVEDKLRMTDELVVEVIKISDEDQTVKIEFSEPVKDNKAMFKLDFKEDFTFTYEGTEFTINPQKVVIIEDVELGDYFVVSKSYTIVEELGESGEEEHMNVAIIVNEDSSYEEQEDMCSEALSSHENGECTYYLGKEAFSDYYLGMGNVFGFFVKIEGKISMITSME